MGAIISTITSLPSTLTTIYKTLSALNTQYQALLSRTSSSPGLPVPNPTSSYWLDNPPFPSLKDISPPLPSETDILIIGSGITSASIARTLLTLSPTPPSILICEARQLCSGATGRNGGHVKTAPYEVFSMFKAKLGPERARELVRFQMRHLGVLLEVGKDRPEGEVREVETVDLFVEEKDFENAKAQVVECRRWVPEWECEVWEGDEARKKFGVNSMIVGALSYKAGALWPYRLVTSIWNDLLQRYPTLTISTHTAVTSTTHSPSSSSSHPYTVSTSRGTIKAKHVIHATNAFASYLIPSLRPHLTGALAHMSAQRPGNSFPTSHGLRSWSVIYRPGFDYITQRPDEDGQPGELMVGGGFFRSREVGIDQIGVWDDSRVDALPSIHVRGVMGSIFEPNWGGGSEVTKAWTGILGITGDLTPLVGRLPSSKPDKASGEWIAAGFNGEGMVWAWLCGTALAILVLGMEDEELEAEVGRPGGRLEEWFPRREFELSEERLRRAELENLVSEVDELGR